MSRHGKMKHKPRRHHQQHQQGQTAQAQLPPQLLAEPAFSLLSSPTSPAILSTIHALVCQLSSPDPYTRIDAYLSISSIPHTPHYDVYRTALVNHTPSMRGGDSSESSSDSGRGSGGGSGSGVVAQILKPIVRYANALRNSAAAAGGGTAYDNAVLAMNSSEDEMSTELTGRALNALGSLMIQPHLAEQICDTAQREMQKIHTRQEKETETQHQSGGQSSTTESSCISSRSNGIGSTVVSASISPSPSSPPPFLSLPACLVYFLSPTSSASTYIQSETLWCCSWLVSAAASRAALLEAGLSECIYAILQQQLTPAVHRIRQLQPQPQLQQQQQQQQQVHRTTASQAMSWRRSEATPGETGTISSTAAEMQLRQGNNSHSSRNSSSTSSSGSSSSNSLGEAGVGTGAGAEAGGRSKSSGHVSNQQENLRLYALICLQKLAAQATAALAQFEAAQQAKSNFATTTSACASATASATTPTSIHPSASSSSSSPSSLASASSSLSSSARLFLSSRTPYPSLLTSLLSSFSSYNLRVLLLHILIHVIALYMHSQAYVDVYRGVRMEIGMRQEEIVKAVKMFRDTCDVKAQGRRKEQEASGGAIAEVAQEEGEEEEEEEEEEEGEASQACAAMASLSIVDKTAQLRGLVDVILDALG